MCFVCLIGPARGLTEVAGWLAGWLVGWLGRSHLPHWPPSDL